MTVLAIDIGGTKFAAALAETDGTLHHRLEIPLGPDPTETLLELIDRTTSKGVTGVGIGSAGPIDLARGTVSPVNIPGWRDFPIIDTVTERLPGLPATLAGDAQCMALGEWWRGDLPGRPLLGIVVSTGIGGGLVLDDRAYLGHTGNAGFLGHISVDPGGEPCPCGATGCLETIASGPSMVRWARAQGWDPAGRPSDARTLAADAAGGHPLPIAAFARAGEALGTVIANTAILLDLDRVIIGGGVAATGDLLLNPIRETLVQRLGCGPKRTIALTRTALDRDAGLYGAAALALHAASDPRRTAPPRHRTSL